jgi:hypothetical protein
MILIIAMDTMLVTRLVTGMDIMTHKMEYLLHMHAWVIVKIGALSLMMDFAPEMMEVIFSMDREVIKHRT